MPAVGVVLCSQAIGLAGILVLALVRGEALPTPAQWGWGAAAGMCGASALVAFYRGLALGRMGLVAPVAGVLGAAVPVVFGTLVETLPRPGQALGMGLAMLAVLLVSRPDEAGGGRDGLGLALIAGLGFGGFFVLIHQVGHGPVFWPIVAARSASIVLLAAVVLVGRQAWRPTRPAAGPVMLAGVLDGAGNLFFLLASQVGPLAVAAVLSSLYPVSTVVLARLVLGERVARVHAAGVMLALLAIALIAAG
ncbi:MAG: EamA family transporter [Candidatus Limnocylindrales bacterium]